MSDTYYVTLASCLACQAADLVPVLDLHEQPLANSYHKEGETLPVFPLALNVCPHCFHAQQAVAVDPDLMFKQYSYVSGTSQTLRDYFNWFAADVAQKYGSTFTQPPSVMDIACNDGTQLASFGALGWQMFGVDPAENLLERSQAVGARVVCDYWTPASAQSFGKKFDILIAQNVFAHNADPYGFLETAKLVMHSGSKLLVQTSQADMIPRGEFDTIYHEHISFFSARSMQALAHRAGLQVEDIYITPVHGGSYVFVLGFTADESKAQARLEYEQKEGRYSLGFFEKFAATAKAAVAELTQTLKTYRKQGYAVVGFGAAAKGNTMLNFSRIVLDYIIDENPLKQNLLTPGMNIPIYPASKLAEQQGKVVIVPLAWNFYDEIHRKVKNLRPGQDDLFVTYFPEVTIRK
ncbi:MAG: class I SAM-dependent methyltransferase [Minisyncoccia bacterium]